MSDGPNPVETRRSLGLPDKQAWKKGPAPRPVDRDLLKAYERGTLDDEELRDEITWLCRNYRDWHDASFEVLGELRHENGGSGGQHHASTVASRSSETAVLLKETRPHSAEETELACRLRDSLGRVASLLFDAISQSKDEGLEDVALDVVVTAIRDNASSWSSTSEFVAFVRSHLFDLLVDWRFRSVTSGSSSSNPWQSVSLDEVSQRCDELYQLIDKMTATDERMADVYVKIGLCGMTKGELAREMAVDRDSVSELLVAAADFARRDHSYE